MTISIDAHAHHNEPMTATAYGAFADIARLKINIGAPLPLAGTQHSITIYTEGKHHDTLVKIAELLNTCSPVPARTPR